MPPNREARRQAEQNGQQLPIISVYVYPDGTSYIDHHHEITDEQANQFLRDMVAKLP